jgi:hypothetical protein
VIDHKELREFLELAERFRVTSVVDDDFEDIRDRFDLALARMFARLAMAEVEAHQAVVAEGPILGPGDGPAQT